MSGRLGPPGADFAHLQQDNAEIERSMLAQEVEALRSRLGLRQVDVSKECGVNASMLSQWMLGRYKGNIARINGLMESWLVNRRGGKPLDKSAMVLQAPLRVPTAGDGMDGFHHLSKRKPLVHLAERPLYKYPKITHNRSSLVPIRLDVDVDGYRYIDSFAYNIHESDFTYETFSASLIRDLDLPDCFYVPIANAIRQQVDAAVPLLAEPKATDPSTSSLVPIHIKLRLHDTIVLDSFEWDVSNPSNSPEHFAATFCADMGLDDGEFQVQIALSIRDQLLAYAKKAEAQPPQTRNPSVVPPHPLRDFDEAKQWEPKVRYVVADDIAVLEREDFKRMRPTSSMPAPLQPSVMPYFPVRTASMFAHTPSFPGGTTGAIVTNKPNRPPKPVNTFLIFCRQWRKKLMAQNPTASAKEASRLLGEMWQKLTEEQRASYQPLADKENAQRMAEWKLKEKNAGMTTAQPMSDASKTPATSDAAQAGIAADDDDELDMDDEDGDSEEDEE
ncbi:hypothetical protein H310_10161 [Aphanomyces invadans]|uniref:HMG box domain-containing protein n=1 Tax=Aphanomyces invadans TaxID=157072 RepID=A0A024TRY9_9STRA|nr:hypothetical protein H310_10161 [Aphanomyces invadans]ETV96885.1 hypothetical protein H310_10161 [Aphanomyces invadans]|eukprot:XP_008874662.1 hypothetical protein H310_10161 [Aphanomyces invadans]